MCALFSKRNAQPAEHLSYELSERNRQRILALIYHSMEYRPTTLLMFWQSVEKTLKEEYGFLTAPMVSTDATCRDPVSTHFLNCTDEQALDFIEITFRTRFFTGGQKIVDEINRVFREGSVGYELSPYHAGDGVPGEIRIGQQPDDDLLPRIIRRDNQFLHEQVVMQALKLLSHPNLAVANSEMLRAHGALRNGNFEESITLASSTFESVLKTICREKQWAFNETDTCGTLVDICVANQLCPGYYDPILKGLCTLRNRLGSAHGRGPGPSIQPTKEQAEHLIHIASANILLLAKLAGLG